MRWVIRKAGAAGMVRQGWARPGAMGAGPGKEAGLRLGRRPEVARVHTERSGYGQPGRARQEEIAEKERMRAGIF
jgi:hypothetical protein